MPPASAIADALNRARILESEAVELREALERIMVEIGGPNPEWKNEFGWITPVGAKAMYEMFDKGLRDNEIRRRFDISPTAVSNHRGRWKKHQEALETS